MVKFMTPISEEITRIASDDQLINKVMDEGAEKARISARSTLNEVRKTIGFRS